MAEDPHRTGVPAATPSHGWGLVRVTGRSMRPTLAGGDLLLVRWGVRPVAGSLVVVRLPGGRPLGVKRLVGRSDGGWWVERDGDEGVDSWSLGALDDDALLGRALLRLWPRPRRLAGRG